MHTSRSHFWSRSPRPKMVSGIMTLRLSLINFLGPGQGHNSRDHFWSRNPRPKMVSGSEQLDRQNLHKFITSRDHFWFRIPRSKMVSGSEQLDRQNLHKFITSRDHFWSRISRPEMVSVKGKFEQRFRFTWPALLPMLQRLPVAGNQFTLTLPRDLLEQTLPATNTITA